MGLGQSLSFLDLGIENVFLFSHWRFLLLKSRVIVFASSWQTCVSTVSTNSRLRRRCCISQKHRLKSETSVWKIVSVRRYFTIALVFLLWIPRNQFACSTAGQWLLALFKELRKDSFYIDVGFGIWKMRNRVLLLPLSKQECSWANPLTPCAFVSWSEKWY